MTDSSSNKVIPQAPDLRKNGQLYPTWVMMNFQKYLLPAIIRGEHEDPCNVQVKKGLRLYQEFVGRILKSSTVKSMLLVHGMGSGKTATAINLMNIILEADPASVIVILIKASLRNDPWMDDLETWLQKADSERDVVGLESLAAFKRIHFVHYDGNSAKKTFMEIIKTSDPSAPMLFVVDEAHQFISNVYSNLTGDGGGDRASAIYQHIMNLRKEDDRTRILLMSATPVIAKPFELALQFNLLRPGLFPDTESEFDKMFVTRATYPVLDPLKKNLFQRRIIGLASYYIGATPDLYARKQSAMVELPMSEYQYSVYRHFEKIERAKELAARKRDQESKLFRVYTRLAGNFVFPPVNNKITGTTRPMKGAFDIKGKSQQSVSKTAPGKKVKNPEIAKAYAAELTRFLNETMRYFQKIATQDQPGSTIQDDLNAFREVFRDSDDQRKAFQVWWLAGSAKSQLLQEMYRCSCKMTAIICNSYASPGKVATYSTYVTAEGMQVLAMYYQLAGYLPYDHPQVTPGMSYMEYHGSVGRDTKAVIKKVFNSPANTRGELCMVFLFSPAGAEGIQLQAIRMTHILESDWTEDFLDQVEGRGIRQCSHKALPMAERTVIAFRYYAIKPSKRDDSDTDPLTADQHLNRIARNKSALTGSFLQAVKEAAVDCRLFQPHNQLESTYSCFQFPEQMVLGSNPGPAYQEDLKEDLDYDMGSNAADSLTEKVRVYEIKGVRPDSKDVKLYWHRPSTRVVYDHRLHFPIGKTRLDTSGEPTRTDTGEYIIEMSSGIEKIS